MPCSRRANAGARYMHPLGKGDPRMLQALRPIRESGPPPSVPVPPVVETRILPTYPRPQPGSSPHRDPIVAGSRSLTKRGSVRRLPRDLPPERASLSFAPRSPYASRRTTLVQVIDEHSVRDLNPDERMIRTTNDRRLRVTNGVGRDSPPLTARAAGTISTFPSPA